MTMLPFTMRLSQASRLALRHIRGTAVRTYASTNSALTITLPEDAFRTHNIQPPSSEVQVTKEEMIDLYKQLVMIRRMETAADGLYKSKKIRGFCHLCTGQVSKAPFFT
jgi:pyruvate dehydrogenase E1 component alpha subunit